MAKILKAPEGLRFSESAKGKAPSAGVFELPPDFPAEKFASSYVKKGNDVKAAEQDEQVVGTQFIADGWQVWKRADGTYHQVTISSGTYILMHRPRHVQLEINRAYGNLSRERMQSEQRGETIAGSTNSDSGMLSADRLPNERDLEPDLDGEEETVMHGS